jgi:hypothetical protein
MCGGLLCLRVGALLEVVEAESEDRDHAERHVI